MRYAICNMQHALKDAQRQGSRRFKAVIWKLPSDAIHEYRETVAMVSRYSSSEEMIPIKSF